MITILFFSLAILAIASAMMMILHRNPIYCALFLIITMFCVAGLYVLLNAPFIAAVHIIVYAGAIIVLFLFVIMLLDLKSDIRKEKPRVWAQLVGIGLAAVLLIQLALFVKSSGTATALLQPPEGGAVVGSTVSVGKLLYTTYLFPFELASVLLLSAIIGAVILAKQRLRS
ncbi:MAG: NADH-quinone oxidoreductase subunit J [Calditrichaeota bacterium]|nr:MAG: NADH-quinone oxidoreductase subunit J [Calditrichota bacterium]